MKMHKRIGLIFFVLLLNCSFLFAQNRVALVIGNANYKNSPLKNPVNDAKAMKAELEELKFKVIYGTDIETADEMDEKLREFYKASKDAEIALMYFSGHGIQSGDVNYLLPVSSAIKSEDDLKRKAINLEDAITDAGASGARQLIVLIDACRNNPLKKSRGASKGLSVVSNDSSESYIVFACASGKTADDGDGNHSPFTQALINHIGEQGVGFSEIMRSVTAEVQKTTNGLQTPSKTDNLSSEIYLNGKEKKKGGEDKKDEIYIDDKTNSKTVLAICFIVFVVLLFVMVLLFLIFTVEGKSIVAKIVNKTKDYSQSSVSFIKTKSSEVKTQIHNYSSLEKEKLAALKEKSAAKKQETLQQKQMAAEDLQKKLDAEKEYMDNNVLPCVKVNQKLYVSKTPVTVGQYRKITGIVVSQNQDLPVTNVNWIAAAEFFNKLSLQENLEPVYDLSNPLEIKIDLSKNGWRLPTEKEWLSFAKQDSDFNQSAWYLENSDGKLPECGKKNSNIFGLYDTFGLVWEWTNDVLKNKYHVLKGGAWDCTKNYCTKASRMTVVKEFSSDVIGFRGVRNA